MQTLIRLTARSIRSLQVFTSRNIRILRFFRAKIWCITFRMIKASMRIQTSLTFTPFLVTLHSDTFIMLSAIAPCHFIIVECSVCSTQGSCLFVLHGRHVLIEVIDSLGFSISHLLISIRLILITSTEMLVIFLNPSKLRCKQIKITDNSLRKLKSLELMVQAVLSNQFHSWYFIIMLETNVSVRMIDIGTIAHTLKCWASDLV